LIAAAPPAGPGTFPTKTVCASWSKNTFDSKDLLLPAKRKTIYDNAKRFYAL
jgi:hypothetical protein